jgi:hypothetical protein
VVPAAVAWFAVGGEHEDKPGGQRQHRDDRDDHAPLRNREEVL